MGVSDTHFFQAICLGFGSSPSSAGASISASTRTPAGSMPRSATCQVIGAPIPGNWTVVPVDADVHNHHRPGEQEAAQQGEGPATDVREAHVKISSQRQQRQHHQEEHPFRVGPS